MSFSFGPPAPCGCRPLRRGRPLAMLALCVVGTYGSPTHAPSLPLAGVSAPRFRNYRSHCAQNKAPLGASAAGVGLILPLHREAPYSQPPPLWRGFLHYTSGTNIRTVRKPRPRRCLCTGAGTHHLQKRNALPLGRTLSQTGFIDLLSADA